MFSLRFGPTKKGMSRWGGLPSACSGSAMPAHTSCWPKFLRHLEPAGRLFWKGQRVCRQVFFWEVAAEGGSERRSGFIPSRTEILRESIAVRNRTIRLEEDTFGA